MKKKEEMEEMEEITKDNEKMKDPRNNENNEINENGTFLGQNNERTEFLASPFFAAWPTQTKERISARFGGSRSSGDSGITRGGFHYFGPEECFVFIIYIIFIIAGSFIFHYLSLFLAFLSFLPFFIFHYSRAPRGGPRRPPGRPLNGRASGTPWAGGPRGLRGRTDPGPDIQE